MLILPALQAELGISWLTWSGGLKAFRRIAEAMYVSGFDSHEIPDWVKDQFNERTALPNGPLEHLPIPVEGQIVGAQSCVPSDGRPPNWNASIVCAESFDDCMRFYEEFLPLASYELVAIGSMQTRRSWFSLHTRSVTGLIIFRMAQYVGQLSVDANSSEHTRVEVEMAHCQHESVRDLVDRDELRKRVDIKWRLRP